MNYRVEDVAISTRIRLARNVSGYPFPHKLSEEVRAREIVSAVGNALRKADDFKEYSMSAVSNEQAAILIERNLISKALVANRSKSAAFVSRDGSISVMVNEEDHLREQYFLRGFDLNNAYERIAGIDDLLSESIPFAYDETLGFLTACPTNVGTGLRASVMLFLPAITRRQLFDRIAPRFRKQGLTVRGAFGEGSTAVGEVYQISNEVTLGYSEQEILGIVGDAVESLIKIELKEREEMKDSVALIDTVLRSLGVLTNCVRISESEFLTRMADLKLGIALGYLTGSIEELDDLIVDMRPASLNHLNGGALTPEERDIFRAEYTGKVLRNKELIGENQRNSLLSGRK